MYGMRKSAQKRRRWDAIRWCHNLERFTWKSIAIIILPPIKVICTLLHMNGLCEVKSLFTQVWRLAERIYELKAYAQANTCIRWDASWTAEYFFLFFLYGQRDGCWCNEGALDWPQCHSRTNFKLNVCPTTITGSNCLLGQRGLAPIELWSKQTEGAIFQSEPLLTTEKPQEKKRKTKSRAQCISPCLTAFSPGQAPLGGLDFTALAGVGSFTASRILSSVAVN